MPYNADEPPRQDIAVWRGDDDPVHVWTFPVDGSPVVVGADFALVVQWTSGGRLVAPLGSSVAGPREFVRTSADGALVLDVGTRTVSWPYTVADFEAVPFGARLSYELRRLLDGRTRTVRRGALTLGSELSRPVEVEPGQPGQSYVDLRIAALRSELLAGVGGGNGSPPPAAGQVFTQASASASWSIPHALGRRPIVAVFDAAGAELLADVTASALLVTVTHAQPTAGSAVLI